ncbi:MAG: FUSC family protein [Pisciglobus halotolerans]|nr:FUSC family protein [Pisciglobus halotolerans]
MMQIKPVSFEQLPQRVLAIIWAFGLATLFIFTYRKIKKMPPKSEFVEKGASLLADQLDEVVKGNLKAARPQQLVKLTSNYCTVEYNTIFKQNGLMTKQEKDTLQILLCMEQMGYLLLETTHYHDILTEKDLLYLKDLSTLFREYENSAHLIYHLDHFINADVFSLKQLDSDWKLVVRNLQQSIAAHEVEGVRKTSFKNRLLYKLRRLQQHWGLSYFQFRFALQSAAIITASYAATALVDFSSNYWIPIMAYTTLCAYPDETVRSAITRTVGTLAGLLAFALGTQFIPGNSTRLLLTLVVGFAIILSTNNKFFNIAIGTQIAVSSIFPIYHLEYSLFWRGFCVILGASIAIIGSHFILKAEHQKTFDFKLNELLVEDRWLIRELNDALLNHENRDRINETFVSLHLIMGTLFRTMDKQNVHDRFTLSTLIMYNYNLMIETAFVFMSVELEPISDEYRNTFFDEIEKLDLLIDQRTHHAVLAKPVPSISHSVVAKTDLDRHVVNCHKAVQTIIQRFSLIQYLDQRTDSNRIVKYNR